MASLLVLAVKATRSTVGLLVWACATAGLLGGCQPNADIANTADAAASSSSSSTAASSASQAQYGATATRDEAIWQALERIERQGLGRPLDSEKALSALQPKTRPGSLERVELLSQRGNLAALLRDRALYDQVLSELDEWPDEQHRNVARLAQALMRANFHSYNRELRLSQKALALLPAYSSSSAPAVLLLRCQLFLANLQGDVGDMDAAIASAHAALKLAEQLNQTWRRAGALSNLAFMYFRAQQFERAQRTSAEALLEAQRDPDPILLYTVNNIRGIIFAEIGDKLNAQKAKQLALDYSAQAGADRLRALALGNYADYHLKQGNYAQAKQLAEEGLALALETKNQSAETLARHNMGIAKIGLKRVEEGKREVLLRISIDERQGANSFAAESWLELGTYLERANDLAGAAHAYHQYRRLSDQVFREESRKAVLEAQEGYDDERRGKEIDLLNRDNSLKTEQLRARDLQLKLWAALGGCIVVSAVLLGLAYQRIRKTNQALASSNDALKIQSERDPLTGLANRRHFQAAIKRLADKGKLSGTVFLIDIDHFKRINDSYGHAAGDSVLIEVAQRLRATVREQDLVVRWGGEEFLIVVDAREAAYASALAQRLLDQIAQPAVEHGALRITITASIGFASFPIAPHALAVDWERAIDLVDTVMYMAKAHGRNKAYGIESIDAQDEVGLQMLTAKMEASVQEGRIKLRALQGPQTAALIVEAEA